MSARLTPDFSARRRVLVVRFLEGTERPVVGCSEAHLKYQGGPLSAAGRHIFDNRRPSFGSRSVVFKQLFRTPYLSIILFQPMRSFCIFLGRGAEFTLQGRLRGHTLASLISISDLNFLNSQLEAYRFYIDWSGALIFLSGYRNFTSLIIVFPTESRLIQ